MFGRKTALIKHYEGEVVRLRQRIADLEHRNSVLVDRLLAKNGVPDNLAVELPTTPAGLNDMGIFEDAERSQMRERSDIGVFDRTVFDDAVRFDMRMGDHGVTAKTDTVFNDTLPLKLDSFFEIDGLRELHNYPRIHP